jgi:hypothetical protein
MIALNWHWFQNKLAHQNIWNYLDAAAQTDVEAVMKMEACSGTSFQTVNPLREISIQTEMTTETKPTVCQNHSDSSIDK